MWIERIHCFLILWAELFEQSFHNSLSLNLHFSRFETALSYEGGIYNERALFFTSVQILLIL